ncbi:hypothetical protein QYM36_016967 [Artemia franciscana]|uniref:HTH psq-type domain-containing protein n=1 Tax=Artemia franciscana TaxID=6661 RepID=A0AA88HCZ0_ARTSF|nr:hypothetical protein QYM36_016967 [Artemia franciscana]
MRTYKRKTENRTIPPEVIRQGVQKILEGGKFATVAREMHIPRSTLKRYTQKFLTEEVTDRLDPSGIAQRAGSEMFVGQDSGSQSQSEPSSADLQALVGSTSAALRPEVVRPYPKAPPKKGDTIKRKKGRSQVLTDTPVKNALIEELSAKKKHKGETEEKKTSKSSKNTAKEMPRKALFVEADNFSSDSENEMVFDNDSDLDVDMDDCKRVKEYFAGEVKEDTSEGYVVNFLWRKSPSWKFVFPEVADESLVPQSDIVMKLPVPRISGGTKRAAKALVFDINLSEYSVE